MTLKQNSAASRLENILERYPDESLYTADGWDEAIIGVAEVGETVRIVYSVSKVLAIMIERDGMSFEDAREYFDYNIIRAGQYYESPGHAMPIWCEDDFRGGKCLQSHILGDGSGVIAEGRMIDEHTFVGKKGNGTK